MFVISRSLCFASLRRLALALALALGSVALAAQAQERRDGSAADASELEALGREVAALEDSIRALAAKNIDPALLADAGVFAKAVRWLVRFPEEIRTPRDLGAARRALAIGRARAEELASEAGEPSWESRRGRVARAYRSRVDGSLQPYGLVVPAGWDGTTPSRLDVILHGRDGNLHEAGFLVRFESETPATQAYSDRIELHVFGRTNNAYRWAGETDVFEAIASVRGRYPVDERRIVLRGFSMGGAGAWHLGLHYPDLWAAVEAGAGFTETEEYARLPNLPPYQVRVLPIYDARAWALNVREVPFVGYGGEDDKQLRAALNVRDRLIDEGCSFTPSGLHAKGPFLLLVGEKMGHRFHPEAKRISDAYLDVHAALPDRSSDRVRFVTYTTRYPTCRWVRVEGLLRHYDRAEVDAEWTTSARRLDVRTANVSRLALSPPGAPLEVRIDDQEIPIEAPSAQIELARDSEAGWRIARESSPGLRKTPGLQGPIDDAFLDAFVCVRPTGEAWNPRAGAYARAALGRFAADWAKWMRGDVPVADDSDIESTLGSSASAGRHLVLFGDPGSNSVLRKILDRLPLEWTRDALVVAGERFAAVDHLPVLIYPNPLDPDHYVVLNSGHTFGEDAFRGTNALLFPRLGDWAVLHAKTDGVSDPLAADVVRAGFFDEGWQIDSVDRVYPGATWATRSPEELGLDAARLEAAARLAGGRGCVVRGGYLVHSWGDIAQRGDVASAAKPVYAHFLFRAIETGRVPSLDERVLRYEPRLGALNAELGHPDREITWRHLATQTSCYGLRERPGTAFAYNDWQMALFVDLLFGSAWGVSLTTVDDQVLHPYLTDRLACEDEPTFLAFGEKDRPGRLAISPRDFARFGLLYLRGGVWKGEPLISREHARLAVTAQVASDFPRAGEAAADMLPGQRSIGSRDIPDNQTDPMGSYAFLWWTNGVDRDGKRHWPDVPVDAYGCFGHGGKRAMVVLPSLDLIVSWNDARIEGREAENAVLRSFSASVTR